MKSVGVLAFHPAFTPPRSGGELRLFHLYRAVAERGMSVELLTPTYSDHALETVHHAPRFSETRFPKTSLYNRLHHLNDRTTKFAECSGLVASLAAPRHEAFRREAARLAAEADILVQAYAFLTPLIPTRRRQRQLFVYDAHNVETDLARTMFGDSLKGRLATARIESLERRMLREADLVMACSDEDAETFHQRFGVDRSRLVVIPNGVDINEVTPAPSAEARSAARDLLQLSSDRLACFFIGSFHPPNIEAVEVIIREMAGPHPEVDFLIAGRVCKAFEGKPIPANLRLLGLVSEEQKHALFHGCDVALNPMISGSGTNLKMLDYLAAGLPILATPAGARGLSLEHCVHASIQPVEGLRTGLKDLLEDARFRDTIAREGRRTAEQRFSWKIIGDRVADLFTLRTGRRVMILNDYAVMPATQGGQIRVEAVARHLAAQGNAVTLITLTGDSYRHLVNGPTLEEVNIPRGFWHRRLDVQLQKLMGCGCDDVSAILFTGLLTRAYGRFLRRELKRTDAVLLSHPYMERLSHGLPRSVVLHYDSHNTEFALKKQLYRKPLIGPFLQWIVRRTELAAARRAKRVFCVSDQNLRDLCGELSDMSSKGSVAPNGVDCARTVVRARAEKSAMKAAAGLNPNTPVAVFIGSGHPPNAEAARVIRDQIAPHLPGITFLLIGSVTGWFHGQGLGDNVIPIGPVETPVKDFLMQMADVALNPMLTGSGTSLKLFDYMAHGLPVVTTATGARGLSADELAHLIVAEPGEFATRIRALLADPAAWDRLAEGGRRLAEERYDWPVALAPFNEV